MTNIESLLKFINSDTEYEPIKISDLEIYFKLRVAPKPTEEATQIGIKLHIHLYLLAQIGIAIYQTTSSETRLSDMEYISHEMCNIAKLIQAWEKTS